MHWLVAGGTETGIGGQFTHKTICLFCVFDDDGEIGGGGGGGNDTVLHDPNELIPREKNPF